MSLEEEIRLLRTTVEKLTLVMERLAGAGPTSAALATLSKGAKNIEELWTVKDVAAYLKMSRSSVYSSLTNRDAIPAVRMGSIIRFDPDAVKAWVAARQAQPATLKNFPR